MPAAYLAASIGAFVQRDGLRAKSGLFGQISLWLPLAMSGVLALVLEALREPQRKLLLFAHHAAVMSRPEP